MESIKLTFANPEVRKQWYAGRPAPTQVNNDDDLILSIKSLINDTLTQKQNEIIYNPKRTR